MRFVECRKRAFHAMHERKRTSSECEQPKGSQDGSWGEKCSESQELGGLRHKEARTLLLTETRSTLGTLVFKISSQASNGLTIC